MNTMIFKKIKIQHMNILFFLLMLFVISFQFQWQSRYKGTELRFSIADILLPILFLFFFLSANKNKFFATIKKIPFPFWFLIFSLWLGMSLYIGYTEIGRFSIWAVVNKFCGWFILILYFITGNLIQQYHHEYIKKILKTLFISCGIVSLICFFLYIPFRMQYAIPFGINGNGRFIGFLVNPNTYGLFATFVVLLQIPFLIRKQLLSYPIHCTLIFTNITAILLTGSRSAMITLIVGIIGFMITNNSSRRKSLFLVLFGLIILMSFIDFQKTRFYILDYGANVRIQSATLALDWWKEKPYTGIGLGSFLSKQEQQQITPIMTIHNTPIWLLTETGLIGLLLYGWFVFKSRSEISFLSKKNHDDLFSQGMLIIFPAFIVASFTTEIFYQRYLWFFLGLVLSSNPRSLTVTGQESLRTQ